MARAIARGDVYLHRFGRPDKRRPVVVISRQDAIDALGEVMVAPVTSTIRGIPSEVALGPEHGLKQACAANLDHVMTVRKEDLRGYVATLGPEPMRRVCEALAIATGC
jgi:mRNA interferase MazF